MSDELYTPATSSPWIQPSVPIGYETWWAPVPGLGAVQKRKFSASSANSTTVLWPFSPQPTHYTDSYSGSHNRFDTVSKRVMGRDSVVGIAPRYRLDGPGIKSRWGRDFSKPSRPALGPTQPPIQWIPGLFPGVKRPGRGVDHPPSSSARVKEKVELYLYSPSGPSWPVLG